MVGIISALYYFTSDKLTVNAIIFSLFTGYGALHFFFKEIKDRISKHNYKRTVSININGKKKTLSGYIDTGNELSDPVTGKPVMVVNIDCIKDMLNDSLYERILDFYKDGSYEKIFMESNINLRIIKYNTISSKGEKMVCIVPDGIEILDNSFGSIDAIIGVYPRKISNEDYDALLFKKILDWEMDNNNECVNSC